MRRAGAWQPSKYVEDRAATAGWAPNPRYVAAGSLFACRLLIDPLAAAIRAHARARLLDAGCGDVPYFGLYRDLAAAVTCVDWPGSSHGAGHLDAYVDLNRPLPFGPAAFDTVLLADVLEHVAEPAALVAELARVLAVDGALVLSVPFLYWVHEAPHDYQRFTEFGLRHLCATADLEVVSIEPWGGHPDVVLDLVGKVVARGRVLGSAYAAVSTALGATRAYRRLRRATQAQFPLGYVLVARRR
jgi:SAM-dependent methyltransferase